MKVALIERDEFQKIGGLGVFNQRFKEFLRKNRQIVYSLRFSKKRNSSKDTFHLPYYYAEARTGGIIPSERSLGLLRNYLKRVDPDLIYANPGMVSPLDFFFPSLAKELGIPMIGTWHMDFNKKFGSSQILTKSVFLAYLSYCKKVDLLHVFSEQMKKFYVDRGVDPKKILVLPNGVESSVYSPGKSEFGQKHKIQTGVLFLGRLTYQKNPEALLETFLSIDPPEGTKLVVVGYGDLEKELRSQYKDPRIIFTGAVTDEKKKVDIIRSCKIFVQPSRFEGMSISLLEAMSTGLACIATDVATNEDVLDNVGIVIEGKVKEQLSVALKLCLDQPEFTASLGRKARERVLNQFNQQKIFQRLAAEFQRVVNENPKRKRERAGLVERILGQMGFGERDERLAVS